MGGTMRKMPGLSIVFVAVVACLAAMPAGAWDAGQVFRDCDRCPEMTVLPAGEFQMGGAGRGQGPLHTVTIARPFALASAETTFDEWQACVDGGGCGDVPDDHTWGRGRMPVINITWEQANDYAAWLSRTTGATYRLPSEAEWEFAAQGGKTTPFWWGEEPGSGMANCRQCGTQWSGRQTAPGRSFPPNPYGIYDMNGNLWEWVADCWFPTHEGAATDGSARDAPDCQRRVSKGGAWYYVPILSHAASRAPQIAQLWSYTVGFRVLRELQ